MTASSFMQERYHQLRTPWKGDHAAGGLPEPLSAEPFPRPRFRSRDPRPSPATVACEPQLMRRRTVTLAWRARRARLQNQEGL
jgi:hypothetical protein